MGNILVVTGAAGKRSGGALAQELHRHLPEVLSRFPGGIRLLVRPATDCSALRQLIPDAEVCAGDLSEPSFLLRALSGADTVLHIAGIQVSEPLTRAAAQCGVRRLILVHTTGIYSKYKQAGEGYRQIDAAVTRICRENGIRLTLLRPTMIYGNPTDQNVIRFIRMVDRLPLMPVVRGGRYPLQPVHYEDLAQAYYRALVDEDAAADRSFILSGGEPILLRDMLSVIGRELGKDRVRFVSCPYWLAYSGAVGLWALSLGRVDYREKVQRLCESRAYPHDEAAEALGFAPRTFPAGVGPEVEAYLQAAGRSIHK